MAIRAMIFLLVLSAGLRAETIEFKQVSKPAFRQQWYNSGAEISRYALSQIRYGELHRGEAVLIFVTETLNPKTQIKADRPDSTSVPILKLNLTRKFTTGIYPYSVMTSIFTPTAKPTHPLKVSFSAQEWCGHVYMQMNLKEGHYAVSSHSYFEGEGDETLTVKPAITEDGIWNLVRLAPMQLPTGEFRLLPSAFTLRLDHRPLEVQKAKGTLKKLDGKTGKFIVYTVDIANMKRKFSIVFEHNFPHGIQSWSESKTGTDGVTLTTRAILTHRIMTDYWNRNRNADRALLKNLGLKP